MVAAINFLAQSPNLRKPLIVLTDCVSDAQCDMARTPSVIPIERIAGRIYLIRGQKVMLDSDLRTLWHGNS